MTYMIFCAIWGVSAIALYATLYIVALLWLDELFSQIAGRGIFELFWKYIEHFLEKMPFKQREPRE